MADFNGDIERYTKHKKLLCRQCCEIFNNMCSTVNSYTSEHFTLWETKLGDFKFPEHMHIHT